MFSSLLSNLLFTVQIYSTLVHAKVVKMEKGLTWANRAWGSYSERDSLDGMKVVNVDLFDTSSEDISKLKEGGRIVTCYVSAGTIEDWRDDVKANQAAWNEVKAKSMDGWSGETWIDITQLNKVKDLMGPRFDMAKSIGCDGIEADNVDCYSNLCVSGYSRDQLISHQKEYSRWQTDYAHKIGCAIGLKNSMTLIDQLVSNYDFGVNEECVDYNDCHYYDAFAAQNKAAFGTEYSGSESRLEEEADKYSLMMKVNYGSGWQNLFDKASDLPPTEYYR